jgi:2-polyprenyl-3-methyl-5-hydroxy-6-metoxy-1,4-benzoquinol methylase
MLRSVTRPAFELYKVLGRLYLRPLLVREWKRSRRRGDAVASGSPPTVNERPVEYAFALRWLGEIRAQHVLDVGSGGASWPQLLATCGFSVTAIDRMLGYWQGAFFNRHYHVVQDDITQTALRERFDAVTCLSVLEHIQDHPAAMRGMFGLLRPGGHIVLTVPFNRDVYLDNVYAHPDAGYSATSYVAQVFSRKELEGWLAASGGELVAAEYHEVFTGEYWTMGRRVHPPRRVDESERHHLGCFLLRGGPSPGRGG